MARTEEEKRQANREAIARYDAKIDRVNCRFPKGTLERIRKLGYASVNAFVLQATMGRLETEEKRANMGI